MTWNSHLYRSVLAFLQIMRANTLLRVLQRMFEGLFLNCTPLSSHHIFTHRSKFRQLKICKTRFNTCNTNQHTNRRAQTLYFGCTMFPKLSLSWARVLTKSLRASSIIFIDSRQQCAEIIVSGSSSVNNKPTINKIRHTNIAGLHLH